MDIREFSAGMSRRGVAIDGINPVLRQNWFRECEREYVDGLEIDKEWWYDHWESEIRRKVEMVQSFQFQSVLEFVACVEHLESGVCATDERFYDGLCYWITFFGNTMCSRLVQKYEDGMYEDNVFYCSEYIMTAYNALDGALSTSLNLYEQEVADLVLTPLCDLFRDMVKRYLPICPDDKWFEKNGESADELRGKVADYILSLLFDKHNVRVLPDSVLSIRRFVTGSFA